MKVYAGFKMRSNTKCNMRVCDYIADFIRQKLNTRHVFMVTGGGAMFLNDGIACHPDLQAIANHHEQASAMAAVAYSKYTNGFGVVIPTTGCGGTNCITGLLDAWQDNVKVFFISGQDKSSRTVRKSKIALRQAGIQEADIISIVSPISKYAAMVETPNDIAYHLEKAKYAGENGRPGPVWLDIPMDVQSAIIDPDKLRHYKPRKNNEIAEAKSVNRHCHALTRKLNTSKRPLILVGNGVRLGSAIPEFINFVEKFEIPVVSTYLGIDILPTDHPQYVGRIGIKGDRAGNFAVQNCDLLISLGSRLSTGSTGYNYETFARNATIWAIDIDANEHKKRTVKIDKIIRTDVKQFLSNMPRTRMASGAHSEWNQTTRHWKEIWPTCLQRYKNDKNGINLYHFIDKLNQHAPADATIIADAGSAYYVTSQALRIAPKQRYITSGAQADMGFTLPGTIGASLAKGNREVIGITGDGSFQMNIQELQTIIHHKLPIKLFIWNNNGYLSIRATQKRFFSGRLIGTDPSCGVSFPDLRKIAKAYGIRYYRISSSKSTGTRIKEIFSEKCAVLAEVICDPNQELAPILGSTQDSSGKLIANPLEDMHPLLPRDVFRKEMIIEPLT